MTSLRNIENQRGTLDFVRRGETGTVHVVAQPGPSRDPNPEYADRWGRATRRRDEAVGHPMTTVELLGSQPVITLCGQLICIAPGFDGRTPDCFMDTDLCGRCHRALGDRADRAFEHRQPGDAEEHDDCAMDLL